MSPLGRHLELLHRRRHGGDTTKIFQSGLCPWSLAKRPQIGQDLTWDSPALVRDAHDHVLRGFADEHFDGWRWLRRVRVFLHDSLHRVAQELAHDVLEVAEDVGESRVNMALYLDLWDLR